MGSTKWRTVDESPRTFFSEIRHYRTTSVWQIRWPSINQRNNTILPRITSRSSIPINEQSTLPALPLSLYEIDRFSLVNESGNDGTWLTIFGFRTQADARLLIDDFSRTGVIEKSVVRSTSDSLFLVGVDPHSFHQDRRGIKLVSHQIRNASASSTRFEKTWSRIWSNHDRNTILYR